MNVYEGNEKYIFVSYAHKDKETVMPILEKLRAQGCRIWCDDKLIVGENYNAAIARHLRECDAVLFFLSQNWMQSVYCRSEATVGIEQFRKKVALLYLESCPVHDEVIMLFAGKHAVNMSDPQYLDKLLQSTALRDCVEQGAETVYATAPAPMPEPSASEGLEFDLIIDGSAYSVKGIGACRDTKIVIPRAYQGKPVTGIGEDAFYNCFPLTDIAIPDSVTNIGEMAFADCYSLESITIPNSVKSIGEMAFYGCSSLKSITIPMGVTDIGERTFSCCSALESIKIPSSVTSIGERAFSCCYALASITIPDSVKNIGESAFLGCSAIEDITIPNGVTSIEESVFQGCSALEGITIPNSVTSIGEWVFCDCSSLKSIRYSGTKESWAKIKLDGSWNSDIPAKVIHCSDGDIVI